MKTIQQSLELAANTLKLEVNDLQLWLDQYPGITPYTQIQALRLSIKYQLDPLSDEIGVMDHADGYLPFITIDGWAKLINQHPQFAGMTFREPAVENELPEWMECTIYRHDRLLPIVIKEYLAEVRTDHSSWQQMPRRMLRHRVIQQCARLAFGISQIDDQMGRFNTGINSGNYLKPEPSTSATQQIKELLKKPHH